jgi:hypothetical protein
VGLLGSTMAWHGMAWPALLLYALKTWKTNTSRDALCMTYGSFLDLNSLRVRPGVISERSDDRTRKTGLRQTNGWY